MDRDGPAALAAAAFGLASPLAAYATVLPSFSHVYATFTVAALAILSVRAAEAPERAGRWALAGVALGACVLMRPPCLLFGVFPAALAVQALRGRPRRLALALGLLGVAAAATGVAPLLAFYRLLYGTPLASPTGPNYLHPAHAQPLLLLFAPHGGLFFTTPAAWLAVLGALYAIARPDLRWIGLATLTAIALEIAVDAMPLDWNGASSYGARRLTTLTPYFTALAAVALDRIGRYLLARRGRALAAAGIAALAPVAVANFGAVWGLPRGDILLDHRASQAELYGEGTKFTWSLVDEHVGDSAVLPAALAFHFRYGLPVNRFRDATEIAFYVRDFRTLRFLSQGLPMKDRRLAGLLDGLVQTKEGAKLVRDSAPRRLHSPLALRHTRRDPHERRRERAAPHRERARLRPRGLVRVLHRGRGRDHLAPPHPRGRLRLGHPGDRHRGRGRGPRRGRRRVDPLRGRHPAPAVLAEPAAATA